jgi:hypothetical protein
MASTLFTTNRSKKMKRQIIAFSSSVLVLAMSACSAIPDSKAGIEANIGQLQIIAKVKAPEGTLGGVALNPAEYLKPKFEESVIGAIKGEISDVKYTSFTLAAGKDEPFSISLAQSIMTVKVQASTFDIAKEIKVVTTGGYLSPTVKGIYGRPEGDLGTNGVIEYETAGGSEPPVVGQKVILFLRDSGASVGRVAPYTVVGSAFGRFTLDEASGLYSRKIVGPGDSSKFSELDLVGNSLKNL